MAELATGAVSSLLGVIRNEAQLLGGVRGDVQFIKEEMESMNSFLLHLARTVPPTGEHDEQVRTWMNQVRILANDCNNCIDLYLYRGNREIYRARSGLRRYIWWAPWLLSKMFAQHTAAVQLRELKERARDVGKRRLRYGVEVPKVAGQPAPPLPSGAAGLAAAAIPLPSAHQVAGAGGEAVGAGDHHDDEEEDGDDQVRLAATATHRSCPRQVLFGLRVLEDYFNGKLADWMKEQVGQAKTLGFPSIAVAVPDGPDARDADALANEALAAAKTLLPRSVLVDIPAVHLGFVRLDPEDILCYIWRELELELAKSQSQQEQQLNQYWKSPEIWDILFERREVLGGIRSYVQKFVDGKIEKVKKDILQVKVDQLKLTDQQLTQHGYMQKKISQAPLEELLLLLLNAAAADEQDPITKKAIPTLAEYYEEIIKEAAKKLEHHMEELEEGAGTKQPRQIPLDNAQAHYEGILQEVFPKASNSYSLQATKTATITSSSSTNTTLGDDPIRMLIQHVKQEVLKKLKEDQSSKKQATDKPDEGQTSPDAVTEETAVGSQISNSVIEEKIEKLQRKIEKLMENKGIVDKIRDHLEAASILVILKINPSYALGWEETRKALGMLGRVAGSVIMAASKNNEEAKAYCYPLQESMEYSLVGLYHDIVLQLTRKQMHEEEDIHSSQILHGILDKCKPYEFCMKIFTHALYANPKRRKEELRKLHSTLQAAPQKSLGSIAKKMLKFSYMDLPKEYQSCLLYLAIFPPGHKIRRSTLIGRWVVEGLITTEDWRWSNSLQRAKECFDTLVDRWLIYPTDIGGTGEVKSCMVCDRVHEFITRIAEKQRIVESRLSQHLARHFSILNDLRLRASDDIDSFLLNLSKSSHFSLLKVLDLEGCNCFDGNKRRYLKDICCKILLLKYLSLKRTNVTKLPSEINNLHELEVLDIRQTKVPANATRNILLLKLKRLLAGHIDPSLCSTHTGASVRDEEFTTSVYVPEKIEKMVDMEVLTGVNPLTSQDLRDIGRLCQLRKLGVVIHKDRDLLNLFEAIRNLHQSLHSLSMTLRITRYGGTHPSTDLQELEHSPNPKTNLLELKHSSNRRTVLPDLKRSPNSRKTYLPEIINPPPKNLESLSISGTTEKGQLLPLLAKDGNQLTKVTLANTSLRQKDLDVLSKLHNLCCVKLRQKAYIESKLTFKEGEFKKLKYLLVEGSNMTDITFNNGAAPELEKITLSCTDELKYLSGVEGLPELKELELMNTNATSSSSKNEDSSTTTATSSSTTTTATSSSSSTTTTINSSSSRSRSTSATNSSNSMLLSLLNNARQITKLTLHGTLLEQGDLQILAKKPNLRCLVLLDRSFAENQLNFSKDDFPKLNILIVDCSYVTKINFNNTSADKLKKIVWTFINMESLTGINDLPKLTELEFNGSPVPVEVEEAINKLKKNPGFNFKHNKSESQEQAKGDAAEEDDDGVGFPFCWKNKV